MRILLDVNILASAAPNSSGLPGQMVAFASTSDHVLVISDDMVEKLAEVLETRYFSSRMTTLKRLEYVQIIASTAQHFDPDDSVVGFADDAEDDAVLGTAVAGNADIIVTGDKGLLRCHPFRGIAIVRAGDFLAVIDAAGAEQ